MSSGRITVQGMTPAIFLPGPARPSTAPAKMLSRVAHWEMLRAELWVGTSSFPHKYNPEAELTVIQRTGRVGTGSTETT